ncbi:DNA-binding barrel domain superfamily [Sesbania bispinosa]|nr:DNA-binding barrel domain superfamily [Sesbania bispinosa]
MSTVVIREEGSAIGKQYVVNWLKKQDAIKLPRSFLKQLTHPLVTDVHLVDPHGNTFQVEIEEMEGGLWLTKGLELIRFIYKINTNVGFWFMYEGDGIFQMNVWNNEEKREHQYPHPCPLNVAPEPITNLVHPPADFSEPRASSNNEQGIGAFNASMHHVIQPPPAPTLNEPQHVTKTAPPPSMNNGPKTPVENQMDQQLITDRPTTNEVKRKYVLGQQLFWKPKNNIKPPITNEPEPLLALGGELLWKHKISNAQVAGKQGLIVPRKIVRRYLQLKQNTLQIRLPNDNLQTWGLVWSTAYELHCKLGPGWYNFCRQQRLKQGDELHIWKLPTEEAFRLLLVTSKP